MMYTYISNQVNKYLINSEKELLEHYNKCIKMRYNNNYILYRYHYNEYKNIYFNKVDPLLNNKLIGYFDNTIYHNKYIRENNKNNFEKLEEIMKRLEEKNKFVDIDYDIKVKRK